jgi:hypothetical protein
METPARHQYYGNGTLRNFPIPTHIQGDDYIRIELDGEYQSDRSLWDIVNNSVIFVTAPGDGVLVDVQVATSEEALGNLGSSSNVDIVATSISQVDAVGNELESTERLETIGDDLLSENSLIETVGDDLQLGDDSAIRNVLPYVDTINDNLEASETARDDAEDARDDAETARDLAESYKDDAETARDLAENYKDLANTASTTASTVTSYPNLNTTSAFMSVCTNLINEDYELPANTNFSSFGEEMVIEDTYEVTVNDGASWVVY